MIIQTQKKLNLFQKGLPMIDKNIHKIRSDIPDYVEIIAISKTKPNEDIMKAYKIGHRSFGENKVQEMSRNSKNYPKILFGIWLAMFRVIK